MTRRLVELDENGYAREVDWKRLKKRALVLKAYLDNTPPPPEVPNLRERTMPLIVDALSGALQIPAQSPFNWETREGLLPAEFDLFWSNFFYIACGLDRDYANRIEKDGKVYAWVEFED